MIKAVDVNFEKRIQNVIEEIQAVAEDYERVVVAFSGGVDSTVALFLSLCALGREKVQACTIDWGEYFPYRARENIDFLVSYFQVSHRYLPGKTIIEEVVSRGPACNLCTKKAKLDNLQKSYGEKTLIIGGANQSDSWGIRGLKLVRNTYSPLFDFSKQEILQLCQMLNIPVRRIGENNIREGCVLKHLYKPLAAKIHGQAVVKANQILLQTIHQDGFKSEIANVKIVGTLQRNQALINLRPMPSPWLKSLLSQRISNLEEIDTVTWVEQSMTLIIRANPGLYRNYDSRYWIEKGKIQPDFVQPVSIQWMPSTNRRLRTFQVVDFQI
ncbi:MAG: ExsB family protein [Candidatus Atribacteria bacterium]|nr:ExsB family protein [Candidatus Atribacteria bacterium]